MIFILFILGGWPWRMAGLFFLPHPMISYLISESVIVSQEILPESRWNLGSLGPRAHYLKQTLNRTT